MTERASLRSIRRMTTRAAKGNPRTPAPPRGPTDPLADIVRSAGLGEAVRTALRQALASQLREDHYAKLEQAGHTEDEGIPLRRVFVDLHTTTVRGNNELPSKKGLVAELLTMRPALMGGERHDEAPFLPNSRRRGCAGFVLIGGPGQGKSTLGQLACQMHRVALLKPYLPTLTKAERNVVADFTQEDARKELGDPTHPSLPVRIVLPDVAAWINDQLQRDHKAEEHEGVPWLLRFWCSRLLEPAKSALAAADLLALLKTGPFLLVLDGLDEVPAVEARRRVLLAVRELGKALVGAPGLVLATTRPQGYAGELDELDVPLQTRRLAHLTAEQALIYADRLLKGRIVDVSEREKALERMRDASRESATRRLMTTPLQVTILAALLRKGGRPPGERWNLFERYYDVMYAREQSKPTDTASLLHRYREHINKIHARAGLLLQVESENANRSAALLTRDRLEAIVDAVLSEEGFQDTERPALVEQIVKAAAQRLVFLVQAQEGKFGFEIRSLQEFMAARALTEKSESSTKERLVHVAKSGSFRNVTLFVTGKLFADTGDLRDAIAKEVCPALERDSRDLLAKEAAAGAALALDILEDGAVLNQPKRASDLMRVALGLLDLAPNALQARIGELLFGEDTPARTILEPVLRDGIQVRLARDTMRQRLGAWMALLVLLGHGQDDPGWAVSLADSMWPKDSAGQRAIVNASLLLAYPSEAHFTYHPGSWIIKKIDASLANFSAHIVRRLTISAFLDRYHRTKFRRAAHHRAPHQMPTTAPLGWILTYMQSRQLSHITLLREGRQRDKFSFWSVRIPAPSSPRNIPSFPTTPDWQALASVVAFGCQPSCGNLAATLRVLTQLKAGTWRSFEGLAPWPLDVAIRTSSSIEELHALAESAAEGNLGDYTLWLKAEDAWNEGVTINNLFGLSDSLPWRAEELLHAPPPLLMLEKIHELHPSDMTSLVHALVSRFSKTELAKILTNLINFHVAENFLRAMLVHVPPGAIDTHLSTVTVCREDVIGTLLETGAITPNHLDKWGRHRPIIYGDFEDSPASLLAGAYTKDPLLHGLLYLLAQFGEWGKSWSIPGELLDRARFEDPLIRADAWLVRLRSGMVRRDEIPVLLQDVETAATREPRLLSRVVSVAVAGALDPAVRDELLATIHATSSEVAASSAAVSAMVRILQARTSGLNDPETWDRLSLPLPRPAATPVSPESKPEFSRAPVHLEGLVLQNVRSLEHLEFKMTPPPRDAGQWVVLLGENGVGKSTVLRAIVFALRNLSDPKIWPRGTFASAWRRFGTNPETDTCRIALRLANGAEYEATVRQNGREVFYQSPSRSAATAAPCLLWAYGCRRGSALGGAAREVDTSEDDGPDIATLFDEGASLVHAQTWLQTLDGEASREPRTRSIYDAVIGALKSILDVETIEFDGDSNVIVTGAGVGVRVPLAALSDGYLTTAGWLLDLLARWIARAKQAGVPIEPNFTETMTGLVLLDEIDLHLHPEWQIEVISRVRSIFKRLSFVVTTHNPMTIVGAKPEEIWILRRDEQGVHAEQRQDIPATLTAAQIYGRFFGSDDFFPDPLGRKLQRYGFLCGNAYRSDEEQREMEELRGELQKRDIVPGWQELPRVVVTGKPRAKRRERTA